MYASLNDIYVHQLHDLRSACVQSRDITWELNRAAWTPDLKAALKAGVEGIEDGIAALDRMLERHGEAIDDATTCEAMAGLVKEARREALETSYSDEQVRDAVIITQYQRMAHYAIAGYGSLLVFAQRLGHEPDARGLSECLRNTKNGDEHMTQIATSEVNRDAA
jgi:ferritin-like metal-binding protein YciE